MADILAVRDEYRAQQWAKLIQECKASGMSNKDFCIQRGVSEKSFYYWQKKLRTQLLEAAVPQLIQLEAGPAPAELLQISFRGAELTLPAGVDMDAVSAILRSIQSL
jgi:putative transposase